MARRFNPPPNWPAPPPGVTPPPGWQPDPSWPPPPPGWQLWIEEPTTAERVVAVLRRVYLGPTQTPLWRKTVRAGLLGLLTLSLIILPFSQGTPNVPAESVYTQAPTTTSAATTTPTPTTSAPATSPAPTSASPKITRTTTTLRPPPPPRPPATTRAPRTTLPPPPAPAPTRPPRCDPAYPTVCIPPPPPDLDCPQIPYQDFRVLAPDPHGFDGDGDHVGCES